MFRQHSTASTNWRDFDPTHRADNQYIHNRLLKVWSHTLATEVTTPATMGVGLHCCAGRGVIISSVQKITRLSIPGVR